MLGQAQAAPLPRAGRRRNWESRWTGLLFVAPFVLGLTVLFLLPLASVPVAALTRWSLLQPPTWAGLANYSQLANDAEFARSALTTLALAALLVPTNVALAMALALLLNVKARGVGLFRAILFSPVVVPVVAWSLVWKFVLQPDFGLINTVLARLGLAGPNWLFEAPWALVAVVAGMVVGHVGLNMVIFLGALQAVPREVQEAATIDGATPAQTFVRVTLPMIAPTVFLVVVVTVIGSFKAFAPIYVLTGGSEATTVTMIYMWKQGFKYFEFGYASTIAWVLFLATLGLTVVQWRLRKRWVFHES